MNSLYRSPQHQGSTTMRSTVLGELHQGKLRVEESHAFLKQMVRITIIANALCCGTLWFSFRIKALFPPHDQPFMPAMAWYFFFGGMYGVFAQMSYSFGRYSEEQAVTRALTQNRSYQWHSRYDTGAVKEDDIKKVAPPTPERPTPKANQSVAVGAGQKSFNYAGMFVAFGLGTCVYGIYTYVHTLF